MKTGVIVEIRGTAAVLLLADGAFVEQRARPGWEVGGVVALRPAPSKTVLFRRVAALAACLVVLALAGWGARALFFETASVISIDVNPSMELTLNRLGRVVDLTLYSGGEGAPPRDVAWRGKPYEEVVSALLQSDALQPYLAENEYLEFAVYSEADEEKLLAYLDAVSQSLVSHHPDLQVGCHGVGQEVVAQAHEFGISPGKMRVLLELQQLDPTIDLEEYSGYSMGTLRQCIRACYEQAGQEQGKGQGYGHGGEQGDGQGGGQDSPLGGNGQGNGQDGSQGGGGQGHHGSGHGHGKDLHTMELSRKVQRVNTQK